MKFNTIIYLLMLAILILSFGIIYQIILSTTIDENSEKHSERHQPRKKWLLTILKPDHKTIGYSIVLGLCIAILYMSIAVFAQ